ncbi:conjugal transfer protein [Mycolicibacterium conceptionense]|uniref:conjugal transfer protein n=1 Tax=Mycolicibacterium conceptionense TaxID=451644 RepID=UPI003204F0DA
MPTITNTESADRRLLRATTRRQQAKYAVIVVVVVLAAVGGVGQIVSGVSAVGRMVFGGTGAASALDTTATDTAAGVTDFAQSFVMDYLAASKCPGNDQDCPSADLSAYYTGSFELPETKIDAIDPQVYSVLAEPGPLPNLQLWSVVISVAQRNSADSLGRRRVYYQVNVTVLDGTRRRATTPPAVVPGPAPGVDVSLDYETVVSDSDPAVTAITGFLRALLAGGPDMSRYVASGYPAKAITPPLFQSLTVSSVKSQAPVTSSSGSTEVRMLADIKATRAFSTVSMQYPLRLIVTDGRWEVAGIEIFPALGSKASEPQPHQSTADKTAADGGATSDSSSTPSGDSVFGKP